MSDNSLKKLINLAKIEGNKFFVLDQQGEPVLVMLSVSEYEKLLVHKIESFNSDIEQINREILEAQKRDAAGRQAADKQKYQEQLKSEIIDSTFSFENAELGPNATATEAEDL